MEFQWGRIAERRPNLFVESAHVGLAHRLGRVAVQLDCLVIEPEISRQIAFIPALTRLFNTARDRTHCFLLSRSLNSSFCPFQFLQASGFARRPRPCSTSWRHEGGSWSIRYRFSQTNSAHRATRTPCSCDGGN